MAGLFQETANITHVTWLDRETGEEKDSGFTDIIMEDENLYYTPPQEQGE